MLPYFFSALTIAAVGRAANKMVEEIRVQFANNPGILEGTVVPDYNRCIEISTKASLKEMVVPGLVAVLSPIVGGLVLGVFAGANVTFIAMALLMASKDGDRK
jgi:K(+)-stimulated pyrophosphate-energized sodium pump